MAVTLPVRSAGGARQVRAVRGIPDASNVPTANTTSDPGVAIPRGAFDSGLGAAAEGFADVADTIAVVAERQQKRFDATKTTEAQIGHESSVMEEFRRRQVEDDPARPDFMKDFGDYVSGQQSKTLGNLPEGISADAKERMRLRMLEFQQRVTDSAGRLQIQAGQKAAVDSIQTATNKWAAQATQNPDFLAGILKDADEGLSEYSGTLDANLERDSRAAARETVIAAAVDGYVAQQRYDDAAALLKSEDYIGDITPATRRALMNRVEAKKSEGRSVERAAVKDLIANDIASRAATGQGVPSLTEDRIRSAFGGAQGEAVVEEWRERRILAGTVHNVNQRLKSARPEEMPGVIASLQPPPGDEDFAIKQRAFVAAQGEAQRILALREKDPAGYVMQMDKVQSAFAAEGDPTAPEAAYVGALRQRVEVQKEIGIARPRLLTEAETDRISVTVDQATAAQKPALFARMQEAYGPLYRDVLQELQREAKIDTANGLLAGLVGKPLVSRELAQAIATGRTELRKGLGAEASEIETKVRDSLGPMFKAALAGGRLGAAERLPQLEGIANTVSMLALQRFRINGSVGDSVSSAVEDVIESRFHVSDTWYVPRVIDGQPVDVGRIENAMDDAIKPSAIRAFDPAPLRSIGDGMPDDARVDAMVNAASRGFWVTNEAGTGAYLVMEGRDGSLIELQNANGDRYEVPFVNPPVRERKPLEQMGKKPGIL